MTKEAIMSAITAATGEGELELDSQDDATAPVIQTGDKVFVNNGATTILTGVS